MEDFLTYEQALKLKELGFNWDCNHYYYEQDKSFHVGFYQNFNDNRDGLELVNGEIIRTSSVSSPTLAQAQKWLRDVKQTEIIINRLDDDVYNYMIYAEISNITTETYYTSYEESLSMGINVALNKLLNNKIQ